MSLKKLLALLLFQAWVAVPAYPAHLSGAVTDSQTGQPVPGVYIKIAGGDLATVSDSTGAFSFADAPGDDIKMIASATGYEVVVKHLRNASDAADIALIPKILRGQDIVVTASRARKGETPAAFSNLTNADINRDYWSQDMPVLLSTLPNVYAYSDAGSGIGYSYLKMRGFDQKRVAVMLNGIPLNDADSHEVFWVDLPDFAASADDIQIQRGVGSSLYGASALGGSINIVTGMSPTPRLNAESGYGSYNTRKLSLSGNSGLVNDNYAFYGRFSQIETDGYRDNSWTQSYSYFVGLARFDRDMVWKLNAYGGPEESHLAYKGITREMMATSRRYNELEFDGEIDHFNQPHYELLHDWNPGPGWKFSNTLYYFNGDGHYTQNRSARDIEEYFPGYSGIDVADSLLAPKNYYALDDSGSFAVDDGHYTLIKADIIKRPTVSEYDWGWIPRITYSLGRMETTVGGEIRIHRAHHFGEVVWASTYPVGLPPRARYYDYRGKSGTASVYALETYRIGERLSLMANIQYQRHSYELFDDNRFGVGFKRSFDYLSPRGGVNFRIGPSLDFFASISTSSRHPAFKDIYDPTDYWSNPSYKPDNYRVVGAGWDFVGKEVKPERLLDFELGSDFKARLNAVAVQGTINLYRMQITDEILPYAGQIDDMGYPISGNAEKTIHQGLEFSCDAAFPANLILAGNFSVNDDHFQRYVEYGFDYENWVALEYDRSGKRIGGFPEAIANYRIEWTKGDLALGLNGSYIGRQYIDNGQTHRLDPFHLLGTVISYELGRLAGLRSLVATARINNVADKKYVASGYIEPDDNQPRYIVGAERNAYISLKASF
jgi:iron complex outermembrane receptor protein